MHNALRDFAEKNMIISFEIPEDIEEHLRSAGADPNQTAKESLLVELYRQKQVTHHQISQALGLNRYEVDGLLKRYDVPLDLSIEEFRSEAASLRELRRG
jgi:predicted HTH domain antitoxin